MRRRSAIREAQGPTIRRARDQTPVMGTVRPTRPLVVMHAVAAGLPAALTAALAAGLGRDERERAGRLLSRRARDAYIVAHSLLRHALRQATGEDDPPLRRDANGRPELASEHGDPPLRFSLSHTDGLAACALSWGGAVGIDVEAVVPALACAEVAETYFARAECDRLAAAPPRDRTEMFFRLWTLKEAMSKAMGRGLSPALKDFAFFFDPLVLSAARGSEDGAEKWQFAEFAPGPAHRMAVAARHSRPEPLHIVCEAVEPARLIAAPCLARGCG
jgi:4'-phosphopantetheinyl transferase